MKMTKLFSVVALAVISFSANAANIVNASKLKIDNQASAEVKAKFVVNCQYTKSDWDNTTVYCGGFEKDLVLENGAFSIPAVKKFSGWNAQSKYKYSAYVEILLNNKEITRVESRYGQLPDEFVFTGKTLYIKQVNPGKLLINHEGADFFGTPATQKENASVSASVAVQNVNPEKVLSLSRQIAGDSVWLAWNTPTSSVKLKDATEVVFDKEIIVTTFDKDAKLRISTAFAVDIMKLIPPSLRSENLVEITPTAINDLGAVELKPSEK